MRKSLSKEDSNMTIYGYARVSTDGQSLVSQDAELHAAGCAKVYAEKISGARSDRPELAKVLKRLESGDVLIVTRLDRLARSTRNLLNILDDIAKRGAGFKSLQKSRRLIGTARRECLDHVSDRRRGVLHCESCLLVC
jgi:DNA invertase Pin-like site-specific DNA recombinase